jgi:hypothetical protein
LSTYPKNLSLKIKDMPAKIDQTFMIDVAEKVMRDNKDNRELYMVAYSLKMTCKEIQEWYDNIADLKRDPNRPEFSYDLSNFRRWLDNASKRRTSLYARLKLLRMKELTKDWNYNCSEDVMDLTEE